MTLAHTEPSDTISECGSGTRSQSVRLVNSGGKSIDLALYVEVLRRHRAIVLVGIALTLALVVMSYVRISPSGLAYRTPEIWSNQSTLVLTQEGAPELRSVLPATAGAGNASLADTSRFASLVDVYANLATSDSVIRVLEHRGLINEKDMENGENPIEAEAVVSTVGGGTTPLMTITATALSGRKATELTRAATSAFLGVVRSRQVAAGILPRERIQVRILKNADEPHLVKPRSKALPILVLLAGLIATAAVVFTRDNLTRSRRPMLKEAAWEEPSEPDSSVVTTRTALGPVHSSNAPTAREERGASGAHARGRSTLGSVPRPESPSASEHDVPDDVAQQARRR